MTKTNVLIISCDNGLGHIKRSMIIGSELITEGYNVYIACSKLKFSKLYKILNVSNKLSNINLVLNHSLSNDSFKKKKDKLENILQERNYKIVISDNLIEPLYLRSDTIILANFWWHEILNLSKASIDKYENLLRSKNPTIIGSNLFSTLKVKKYKNFKPTGIITKKFLNSNKQDYPKNILISIGASKNSINSYVKFFKKNLNKIINSFDKIYCDPILINSFNNNDKIIEANYSNSMYSNIDVAIVRPGIGTITDLLSNQCIPICVYENNFEMISNALQIENSKIGLNLGIIDDLNNELEFSIIELNKKITEIKENIKMLNFNGLKETICIIKSIDELESF